MPSQHVARNIEAIFRELHQILTAVDLTQLEKFLHLIRDSSGIFLSGAGRSGLMIRAFAMRLGQLGLPAHLPGDLLAPPLKPGQTLVIASGSGETASLIAMARRARDLGAVIALITANPSSTLAGLAECVIRLDAPASKLRFMPAGISVQPMGSLFEQATFLFFEAAVMELMRLTGQDAGSLFLRQPNLE